MASSNRPYLKKNKTKKLQEHKVHWSKRSSHLHFNSQATLGLYIHMENLSEAL